VATVYDVAMARRVDPLLRGLRNVSVLNIARIAAALDVPVRDLLGPREVVRSGASAVPPLRRAPRHEPAPADWKPGRYLSLV
jgi:transcriptional regulator with XRE-family HTH domain